VNPRPGNFDLAAYWSVYQRDFHERLHRVEAVVRLAPGTRLNGPMEDAVAVNGRTDEDGWTRATVPVESVEHAHHDFLRLGADIEVLEPAELREGITETVSALARTYARS
jgi:predicted DNA-binding transcriptional regulator YafY